MSQAEFIYKMFHKALILNDLLINFCFLIFSIFLKVVIWVICQLEIVVVVVVAVALFRAILIKTTNTLLIVGLKD